MELIVATPIELTPAATPMTGGAAPLLRAADGESRAEPAPASFEALLALLATPPAGGQGLPLGGNALPPPVPPTSFATSAAASAGDARGEPLGTATTRDSIPLPRGAIAQPLPLATNAPVADLSSELLPAQASMPLVPTSRDAVASVEHDASGVPRSLPSALEASSDVPELDPDAATAEQRARTYAPTVHDARPRALASVAAETLETAEQAVDRRTTDAAARTAAPPPTAAAATVAPRVDAVGRGELTAIRQSAVVSADAGSAPASAPPVSPHPTVASNAAPASAEHARQAPVDTRSPAWTEAFAGRIQWLVDHRVGEARIKLNPPELGAVDVKISLVDDKTFVQLTAATAAARDELAQGLPRLRELFVASGIELGGASVHGGRDGRTDHDGAAGYAAAAWASTPGDLDDAAPAMTAARSTAARPGRIDTFA